MRKSAFGPFKRGLLFKRLLKNFHWSPLCSFPENVVLGDLAIIAITCPFGHFWSRCFRQNILQSLHFKCILIGGYCHLRQRALRPFKRELISGQFLKNFSLVPPLHLFRKCGFWVTLQILRQLGHSGTFGAAVCA